MEQQQLEWESTFRHLHKLAGAETERNETKDLGNKLDYNLHCTPHAPLSLSLSHCLSAFLVTNLRRRFSQRQRQRQSQRAKVNAVIRQPNQFSLLQFHSVAVAHVATTQFCCL